MQCLADLCRKDQLSYLITRVKNVFEMAIHTLKSKCRMGPKGSPQSYVLRNVRQCATIVQLCSP